MKLALCSDLHLEFGPIELINTEGAEVLILSGDICIASEVNPIDGNDILGETKRSKLFHEFFQKCASRFAHVIYIAGNHEHYHGDFATSLTRLKTNLAYLDNLHVLDKETFTLGDVTFVGGTLWTDMNKEDPNTIYQIKGYMNDYKIIEDSSEVVTYKAYENMDKPVGMSDEEWLAVPYESRVVAKFKTRAAKFSPEKSVFDHKQMLFAIAAAVESAPAGQKIVVVGHHSPSKLSTKPQYEDDVVVNGAYSSDLSEFMLDRPAIKLWTHGHTHHVFDYMIGSTRVACNPRGYIGYEGRADEFTLMFIDV
jgi:DNA repair exonuclease SbcCD nuclease subunit